MPSVIPLGPLLGAGLLGLVISAVIYGITCLQTYLYFTKYAHRDRWILKFTVCLLWILDTFHLVLVTIMLYHYTVNNWGDVLALSRTTWSLELSILVGTLLTLVVQCFFAHRIWLLSGKNWLLTGVIILLSLFQLGFGTAFMVHGFQVQYFIYTGMKKNIFITSTALSGDIACDIVITISMCYYLQKNRTHFKGTNTMIDLLIMYSIRTCLLTTICTVSCLVLFVAYPSTLIYSVFYFIAIRLYANSLLSTLNTREEIIERSKPQGSEVITLSHFAAAENISDTRNEDHSGASDWLPTQDKTKGYIRTEFRNGV